MRTIKALIIFFIWQLSFHATVSVKAQTLSPKYIVDSKDGAVCEINALHIDELVAEARRSKERIFIISRLSKSEKYKLNRVRLSNAFNLLTVTREIPVEQIVTAIGERTPEKKGRLEFHLGSQLFLVSLADSGKLICLTCCENS